MAKSEKKIILASSSPRRKKILEDMGLEFEVVPSNFEEFLESPDFTYEKIEELAYQKAKAVADEIQNCKDNGARLILSADTVVVINEKILGKPKDEKEAIAMLQDLSGNKHSVVTSICAIDVDNSQSKTLSTTSYVKFEILSEETIKDYVKQYNPLDKAGSYGIQELPDGFVKEIQGSFENIIGLCPKAVKELLNRFDL